MGNRVHGTLLTFIIQKRSEQEVSWLCKKILRKGPGLGKSKISMEKRKLDDLLEVLTGRSTLKSHLSKTATA